MNIIAYVAIQIYKIRTPVACTSAGAQKHARYSGFQSSLASPMSRAEVTGHVIFPNIKVGQHHASTNIAESGKFFYMSFQYKFYRQSYSLLVIQRSLK